jgi:hypothetical protein
MASLQGTVASAGQVLLSDPEQCVSLVGHFLSLHALLADEPFLSPNSLSIALILYAGQQLKRSFILNLSLLCRKFRVHAGRLIPLDFCLQPGWENNEVLRKNCICCCRLCKKSISNFNFVDATRVPHAFNASRARILSNS